jgi:DMSO/TMAO reductase YedYZ heme-binding membrane subunit
MEQTMAKRQAQNTGILILIGGVTLALALIAGMLAPANSARDRAIRVTAQLAYLAVFLASLSSTYMRELTRFFGRSFTTVHHIASVTALGAMALHAVGGVLRAGTVVAFLPSFRSWYAFFSLGGRPALWLFVLTFLTALYRAKVGRRWRTIHWLNYLAFLLATVHAQMIGSDYQNLGMRLISGAMAAILVALFARKRLQRYRRKRLAQQKLAEKKAAQRTQS